jgi:hypothetical protein
VRESAVERLLVKYAKDNGALTLKLNGPGDRGKPDRWFGFQGRSLFLEVKRPGEEPSALQYWWLGRLRKRGFAADSCDNVEDGISILKRFFENKPLP